MSSVRKKKTRHEKQRETREALISAGLKVVVRHGYRGAMVQRITEAAGVAQGTLYRYFDSHQAFLDELLPSEGHRFIRGLPAKHKAPADFFERERQVFIAFARFLKRNRHFLRLLTDAESMAPSSYAAYMTALEARFVESLEQAREAGQLPTRENGQSRIVAEVLAGAMGHIAIGFQGRDGKAVAAAGSATPAWAADTYAKFMRHGLGAPGRSLDAAHSRTSSPAMPTRASTRERLLDAAEQVVSREGFAGATVNQIVDEASLSVGTFYTHFDSQQELFDSLLDDVRAALLDHVRVFTSESDDFVERELRGFLGFFDFLAGRPCYIRLESEAAVWAPRTYARHFFDLADSYVRAMRRAHAAGELSIYEEHEFPVLACILMAARHYIAARYVPSGGRNRRLPPYVFSAYSDFVCGGLTS